MFDKLDAYNLVANLVPSAVIAGMIVFLFALQKEDGYIHSRIESDRSPGSAE
jgi:hypothetical protein